MEIVGQLKDINYDEFCISVEVDDKVVSFPLSSLEAISSRRQLKRDLLGKKVGILRTNLPSPILIRVIETSREP
jgi:hypothetical protein